MVQVKFSVINPAPFYGVFPAPILVLGIRKGAG